MWVSNVRRRVAEAGCTRREGNFGLGRPLRCCRHYESKSRLGHGAPSARGTGRLPPLGHVGRSAHNFQVPHQAPVDRDFVRPWVVWATTTGDAGGGSATAALALMSWLSLIRFGTARRRSIAWSTNAGSYAPGRRNTHPHLDRLDGGVASSRDRLGRNSHPVFRSVLARRRPDFRPSVRRRPKENREFCGAVP
jgi:hypothetical protein